MKKKYTYPRTKNILADLSKENDRKARTILAIKQSNKAKRDAKGVSKHKKPNSFYEKQWRDGWFRGNHDE
mgnify:CR=1 FL=1